MVTPGDVLVPVAVLFAQTASLARQGLWKRAVGCKSISTTRFHKAFGGFTRPLAATLFFRCTFLLAGCCANAVLLAHIFHAIERVKVAIGNLAQRIHILNLA